jgi:hypothetical protein
MKLKQVVNKIVDVDLAYIASYNAGTAIKVKILYSRKDGYPILKSVNI